MSLALGSTVRAAEGRVLKVLPQFLDQQGRQALTPSLYDRDAYQAFLRKNPAKCSALRFAVQWQAKAPQSEPLQMRVELRGAVKNGSTQSASLNQTVHRRSFWRENWAYLALSEADYKTLGEVTAWRVTLWDGDQLLAEQKSFLW